MDPVMTELFALYAIDSELVALKQRHDAGPEKIKAREAAVASARAQRREIEQLIKEKASEVDQCNLDIRSAESEAEDQEQKLHIIKNNKEYKIVTERVKQLKEKVNELESRALEVMEKLDSLRQALKERQAEAAEGEQELETLRRQVEQEDAEIRGCVDDLKVRREEQVHRVEAMNPDVMAVYQQALRRGRGDAMARMQDGVCQTCFRRQTPNVETLVLVGREIKKCVCAGCGRILYAKEEN